MISYSRRATIKFAAMSSVAAASGDQLSGSLQNLLNGFARKQKLPGAVLRVVGPRIDTTVCTGVLNRMTRNPITANSRFYIASVGKMIVATAILQLLDEGRVRLDDRVSEIIKPAGALTRLANWNTITIEQLLTHTSGLIDYFTDEYEDAADKNNEMLVNAELAVANTFDKRGMFKPGTKYNYSNTNFVLLGLVIECIDGSHLGTSLQRRIFKSAGMRNSSVGADPAEAGVASGHSTSGTPSTKANLIAYASKLGDGPVTTTADDMTRFMLALFSERRMLQPRTLKQMLAPSLHEAGYGLGIELSGEGDDLAVGHDGSVNGFNAQAWYYASHKTAIVFLTNGDYYREDAPDIVSATADIVF